MNFSLQQIPNRSVQPRQNGITMITDSGLSLAEVRNLLSVADAYIDMIKISFGTGMVTPNLKTKIEYYQSHQIPVFFGGLLFEAFVIRNQLKEYLKLIDTYSISHFEISDGAINISQEEKCRYIREFSKR